MFPRRVQTLPGIAMKHSLWSCLLKESTWVINLVETGKIIRICSKTNFSSLYIRRRLNNYFRQYFVSYIMIAFEASMHCTYHLVFQGACIRLMIIESKIIWRIRYVLSLTNSSAGGFYTKWSCAQMSWRSLHHLPLHLAPMMTCIGGHLWPFEFSSRNQGVVVVWLASAYHSDDRQQLKVILAQ